MSFTAATLGVYTPLQSARPSSRIDDRHQIRETLRSVAIAFLLLLPLIALAGAEGEL